MITALLIAIFLIVALSIIGTIRILKLSELSKLIIIGFDRISASETIKQAFALEEISISIYGYHMMFFYKRTKIKLERILAYITQIENVHKEAEMLDSKDISSSLYEIMLQIDPKIAEFENSDLDLTDNQKKVVASAKEASTHIWELNQIAGNDYEKEVFEKASYALINLKNIELVK